MALEVLIWILYAIEMIGLGVGIVFVDYWVSRAFLILLSVGLTYGAWRTWVDLRRNDNDD